MIVHESARRGQLTFGCTLVAELGRKRDTGIRRAGHDDLGREIMPFDLFLSAQKRGPLFDRPVMGLMELAFGGR